MGTIKREFDFIHERLQAGDAFPVKLDAWRCTLIATGNLSDIFIDGSDAFPLNIQQPPDTAFNAWSVVMGGLVVKGEPVMLDDQMSIRVGAAWNAGNVLSIVLVREYYVEGRPGPDKTLKDELSRAIHRSSNRPTNSGSSRSAGRSRYLNSGPGRKVRG